MTEIAQLRAQLAAATQRAEKAEEQCKDLDAEIGEFQEDLRTLVINESGAPDNLIDGKGSDAGWVEFSLCEAAQGFGFLNEKLTQFGADKARAEACCAEMRQALILCDSKISNLHDSACDYIKSRRRSWGRAEPCSCGTSARTARITRALSSDCGKGWMKAEELKPTIELLRAIEIGDETRSDSTAIEHEISRLQKLMDL